MAANSAELSKSATPPNSPPPKDVPKVQTPPPSKDQGPPPTEIPLGKISPIGNIREVDGEDLSELVESVRQHGVLEPVLVVSMSGYTPEQRVRFDPKKVGYEYRLVAGFRRAAAATKAKLAAVPARVLQIPEREILEVQLVENIQRHDLSPMEEATAFKTYLDTGGAGSQAELAKRIGRQPSYVSNRVRLLALPAPVRNLVDDGRLSSSHAEILLKLPVAEPATIVEAAAAAVRDEVSVQDLNQQVTRFVEDRKAEERFKEQLAKVQFPECPACRKTATALDSHGFLEHGEYDRRHHWSASKGTSQYDLNVERARKEEERYKAKGTTAGYTTPKKARPKPVDCTEPATLRSAHDPLAITLALLKQVGAEGIRLVEYDAASGAGHAVLSIGLTGLPIGKTHLLVRPVKYSSGERSQLIAQDNLGSERRATKSEAKGWERKRLPALKLKGGKPRELDPKVLIGVVGGVNNRLASFRKDPELLELYRELEAKGKHRAAVLDSIDELLGGHAHDWQSFSQSRVL